jgi:predicted molibdopterin-dependent oxidoreductase YjgC
LWQKKSRVKVEVDEIEKSGRLSDELRYHGLQNIWMTGTDADSVQNVHNVELLLVTKLILRRV